MPRQTNRVLRGKIILIKGQQTMIDLHSHSSGSDGALSPTELVKYAKEKGLEAIAITDHDTVEGVEEALEAGGYAHSCKGWFASWVNYKSYHKDFQTGRARAKTAVETFGIPKCGQTERVLKAICHL